MNAKIEWDATTASSEDASVDQKLLNHVVPLYNQLIDIVTKFQAVTDLDSAVQEFGATSTDAEIVKLREQIAKAEALIERNRAQINEQARAALMADIDPEFDEAKVKAAYNDAKVELKRNLTNVRDTFKLLGYVSAEVSPAGRESNWTAKNEAGETLLKVADIPKLDGASSAGGSGASEAVKEFNRAAKEWARGEGMKVADKGALSTEVKEGYAKFKGISIPS